MTVDREPLMELVASALGAKVGREVGRHRYAREQLVRLTTLAASLRPQFDTAASSADDDPDAVDVSDVVYERWPPPIEPEDLPAAGSTPVPPWSAAQLPHNTPREDHRA